MNSGAIGWLIALSVLMLVGAALLLIGSRRIDIHQAVRARFRGVILMAAVVDEQRSARPHLLLDWWTRKLQRAGAEVTPKTTSLLLGPVVVAAAIGLVGWGARGIWFPVVAALILHLLLERRSRLRQAAMLGQLPGFVDHVVRGLSTGRTIENTVLLAAQQCRPPLRDVLERVRVNVELGAQLGDELQQAARVHRLRELQLLALAVHVNQRFGGSARELLQSIVTMIQQREQAQRELRALTGETRISAWVLGLLPISVAAYMMAVNPGYLDTMWQDATGQKVLLSALALQSAGAVLLWRMVRSI